MNCVMNERESKLKTLNNGDSIGAYDVQLFGHYTKSDAVVSHQDSEIFINLHLFGPT